MPEGSVGDMEAHVPSHCEKGQVSTERKRSKEDSTPSRKLCTNFDAAVLDVLPTLSSQARAHDWIDNGAGSAVADHPASCEICVRAACEVERVTIEDSVCANNIRCEGREQVKLVVLDKCIIRRCRRHLELAVSTPMRVSEY